jgi:ribonuclease G
MRKKVMKKKILINVEEKNIRAAILENDKLVDITIENLEARSLVGNIYKGRVMDVVTGLQAAFVDIGMEKNAFLHFTDIPQELFVGTKEKRASLFQRLFLRRTANGNEKSVKVGSKPEEVLKPGMVLLVQVKKDTIGGKPPRVTANVALPGRYLVMLPYNKTGGGVSRKIRDGDERARLREMVKPIRKKLAGFIVRTAALQHKEDEILGDVNFLKKRWSSISRRAKVRNAPCLLYNEQDIVDRLVRDVISENVGEIIIDSPSESKKLRKALKMTLPSLVDRVTVEKDATNLFEKYGAERQLQQATRHYVRMKGGGYLIFDEMAALTAIDVNSGGFVGKKNLRETILTTNLHAAEAIASQIRLRDIGGLIVIDFIDMEDSRDRRKVLQKFRNLMKQDRATSVISDFTEFGLLLLTRKRTKSSLRNMLFNDCPYCKGSGKIFKRDELWRKIKNEVLSHLQIHADKRIIIEIDINSELGEYIQREYKNSLRSIERHNRTLISFHPEEHRHVEDFEVKAVLSKGRKR